MLLGQGRNNNKGDGKALKTQQTGGSTMKINSLICVLSYRGY